jgi:hypothetical protein
MAKIIEGINKAFSDTENRSKKIVWLLESVDEWKIPCVFISYQREDEDYAKKVSEYIMSKGISVFFDLYDTTLKFYYQNSNPKKVTDSIRKGITDSNYMLVIVSPTTMNSGWVPFEIGYAYDSITENKLVCLKHKGITRSNLPSYLKTKELLTGFNDLENFIKEIRGQCRYVYESLETRQAVKNFSEYISNPLSEYLDE